MGLTKDYQKFVPAGFCNIVNSQNGHIHAVEENVYAVSACECVNFYNLRTGEVVKRIRRDNHVVTVFALSPDKKYLAIGYDDGEVHLYDRTNKDEEAHFVFAGHKRGINTLTFSHDGFTLVSGGKDCTIVVWDVLSESGKFKLRGHTDSVTQMQFTMNDRYLITSSKDTQIRFWDMTTHSCFYTLSGSTSEVYGFALIKNDRLLIVSSAEVELTIHELTWLEEGDETEDPGSEPETIEKSKKPRIETEGLAGAEMIEEENKQGNKIVSSKKRGSIFRQATGRAIQITVSSDEKLVLVLGGNCVDAFRIYSDEEAKKRMAKKLRKAKKKQETGKGDCEEVDEPMITESDISKDVTLFIARIGDFRADSKLKWITIAQKFHAVGENGRQYRVVGIQNNNTVQGFLVDVDLKTNEMKYEAVVNLNKRGHRSEVRSLAVSNADDGFVTGSADCAILWDMDSLMPLNRLEAENMQELTAALFVPNDKYVVFGAKDGTIYVFEIANCELIQEYKQAHDGAIWSLNLLPNKSGFVSVGSDKQAKFWEFELASEIGRKVLKLNNTRSTELEDEILCCNITNNGKLIIFGLLNFTAKVHYLDSLKFLFSLYGHSLPVMCVDTDIESKLLVTGSSDKGCKLWGLDFGDCRKSLYGHSDAVTAVKFNRDYEEKLFFSAGRDGKIIQWDAVKFHKIQVLEGHKDVIRCLGLAMSGRTLISTSHDKSIRIWEESDELVVLSEQETAQVEEDYLEKMIDAEDIIPGESNEQETEMAAKKSVETIKGTELILEAVDVARTEKASALAGNSTKNPHPLIKAYGSTNLDHFVLDSINRVRSAHLEKSLMMVPFSYVQDIILALSLCIKDRYKMELATRVVMFLLKIHHNYVIKALHLFPVIQDLRLDIPKEVDDAKDLVSYNSAALKLLKLHLEERDNVKIFKDVSQVKSQKRKPKTRSALVRTMH